MENQTTEHKELPIRPYSKKELCRFYRVSAGTFKKWLKEHGLMPENIFRKIFTGKEVERIFQVLGVPA